MRPFNTTSRRLASLALALALVLSVGLAGMGCDLVPGFGGEENGPSLMLDVREFQGIENLPIPDSLKQLSPEIGEQEIALRGVVFLTPPMSSKVTLKGEIRRQSDTIRVTVRPATKNDPKIISAAPRSLIYDAVVTGISPDQYVLQFRHKHDSFWSYVQTGRTYGHPTFVTVLDTTITVEPAR